MRTIRFVKDHGEHQDGAVVELDDQQALDAVVHGHAVDHPEAAPARPLTKSLGDAPENKGA
jgi:hypothetical protein